MENPERVTYFAATQARGNRIPFGIKAKDRARHMYVVGKTGVGKTTLLENLAIQDIRNGEGFAFVDPHGTSCEKLLSYVPNARVHDVVYVDGTESTFDAQSIMDEGKILLIRLPKGELDEVALKQLGNAHLSRIFAAAAGRADVGAERLERLPTFHVYLDEFPSIAGPSLAQALSEARKYKLSLVLSHQYMAQLDEPLRAAIFGNVGTLITFRVGQDDAEVLEKIFRPEFTREDLVNLGRCHIALTLMIDHVGSRPFRATTIPSIEPPNITYLEEAKAAGTSSPLGKAVSEAVKQAKEEIRIQEERQSVELQDAINDALGKPYEIPEEQLRSVFKEDV